MNSSPSKPRRPTLSAEEQFEQETAHLKKRTGTRSAAEIKRGWSKLIVTAIVLGLLWLWGMDAVLFSYNRGDAAHDYLYLHNYGSEAKAQALADAILTSDEVKALNARQGSFQDYFRGAQAAQKRADEIIAYTEQVRALHEKQYDLLSPLNKVRFFLFMQTGLIPPTRWDVLNSSIDK